MQYIRVYIGVSLFWETTICDTLFVKPEDLLLPFASRPRYVQCHSGVACWLLHTLIASRLYCFPKPKTLNPCTLNPLVEQVKLKDGRHSIEWNTETQQRQ